MIRFGSWRLAVGVVAFTLVLLSVVWTRPLATQLSGALPHDIGDPILNTWILWWNARAVPFTDTWWNAPLFFPMRNGLALSEHLAGLSPLSTPLLLAGVHPIGVYNILLILTFALVGVLRLPARPPADRLGAGGVVRRARVRLFAVPVAQLGHRRCWRRSGCRSWLALHAHVEDGRWRWLFARGAWLLQALSNGYYLLFLPVLDRVWMAWFIPWRCALLSASA
jgi:hypothetical protein